MSSAVARGLYGLLSGDATLAGLLAGGVYQGVAPEGTPFPFVTFEKQAGTPVYAMEDGGAALDNEVWTIKGIDRGPSAKPVNAISARLDDILTDGTPTISGATLLYLRRETDVEYSEVIDGETYRHAGGTYRLVYDPT